MARVLRSLLYELLNLLHHLGRKPPCVEECERPHLDLGRPLPLRAMLLPLRDGGLSDLDVLTSIREGALVDVDCPEVLLRPARGEARSSGLEVYARGHLNLLEEAGR